MSEINSILELLQIIRESKVLQALDGLTRLKISKNENPDDCVYVRTARAQFMDLEAERLLNKIREIADGR